MLIGLLLKALTFIKKNYIHQNRQMKHLSFFLLIVCFLVMKKSQAQIQYVDINPDAVLNPAQSKDIDLDLDGSTDLTFTNIDDNSNGIIDLQVTGIGGYLGIVAENQQGFPLVSTFNPGDQIGSSLIYSPVNTETLYFDFSSGATSVGLWQNGVEMYLAFRTLFNKYGWMRCEVNNSSQTLTLKDYAYNTSGNSISAGQVTGVPNLSNADVLVNSFNKIIYMSIPSNTGEYKLSIFNTMGVKILEHALTDNISQIDCSFLNSSIYLVLISTDKGSFSQKIILN